MFHAGQTITYTQSHRHQERPSVDGAHYTNIPHKLQPHTSHTEIPPTSRNSSTPQWNQRMRKMRMVSPWLTSTRLVSANRPISMSRVRWSSKMVSRSYTSAPLSPLGNLENSGMCATCQSAAQRTYVAAAGCEVWAARYRVGASKPPEREVSEKS